MAIDYELGEIFDDGAPFDAPARVAAVELIGSTDKWATAGEHVRRAHTQAERQVFYSSDVWRALRYRALKMHGGCCQCCGARPSPGKPLHVDHIKPRSKYPELELDINNLQVLCADCNLGKSAWDETDWRGNVVPLRTA